MGLGGKIVLKISAEVSQLNATLNQTAQKINSWAAETGGAFKNLEKSILSFTTRVAAIAAPFAAVGGALAVIAQKTATAGDEILKMSQKVGISVEKLSALKYAAELSDVNMDELGTSLGHLSKSIVDASAGTGEASDKFKALGISVKDVNGKIKPTDTLLLELADKFSTMEDGAGKTAIAMAIFGRSGKEMIPFLNQGRDGIKKLTDEAEKMGLVFSKDSTEAANKFNDNITKIKEQINALVYAIGNQLIPAFNQLIGSGDGVLKIGYAIGGIFQGAASSALFLYSGIFKLISGLSLLTDKLGITKDQYKKWNEESKVALEASIELAKKAQENILAPFSPSSATAAEGSKKSGKKTAAPVIIDIKKIEAEMAAFLKKSEDETKRHLEKLSGMKEKQADENLEIEKKSHSEMWGVIQEYNKKMAEADKAGLIDRTGIYEWFRLQVGEIRKKGMQAELDEAEKKNSFIAGLSNQILSAEKELYGEEWALVQEYYQKKVEAAKYGAEAELELEKWLVAEMEAVRSKIKPIEPPEPPKKWYGDMGDYTAALGVISSGSLSGIAGLFGPVGKLIGVIIELISNIKKLPDLLKAIIKGLVDGVGDIGLVILRIINEIILKLPEILMKFWQGLIKSLEVLLYGGKLESELDKEITINLDTTEAMNALAQAQDALLGAVNETDRAVAREALLSARQAAILAEQKKQAKEEGEPKTYKGLVGVLQDFWDGVMVIRDDFSDMFKSVGTELSNAWEKMKTIPDEFGKVMSSAWEDIKNGFAGLGDYLSSTFDNAGQNISNAFNDAVENISRVFSDAWENLKNAFGSIWDNLKNAFGSIWDNLKDAFGSIWDSLSSALGGGWDSIKNAIGPVATDIGLKISDAWESVKSSFENISKGVSEFFQTNLGDPISKAWEDIKNAFSKGLGVHLKWEVSIPKIAIGYPGGEIVLYGGGNATLLDAYFHKGGFVKAHSGGYLKDDEVPIIAQFGEGILNKYKGMTAIGGEAGLNYANKYGSLPGGGSQNITQHITQHQYFEVITDKDGNVLKLTRTQAKNLARTLDPMFKEMKRNGELSFV